MTAPIENIIGPRVPAGEWRQHRGRYLIPTLLLVVAGAMLIGSYFLPYWSMTLHAPQYPKGLHVHAYLNRLEGDVHEIDGLNHYIGMRPLNDAAQLERDTSAMLVIGVAFLLVAAVFVHSPWAALAALPALLFPAGFLADLQFWLANFGTHLDPRAALSSSIKPFVPPVLGEGVIGQFRTVAVVRDGFWLATAAAVVVLAALFFHRRAYKPLLDARRRERAAARGAAVAATALFAIFGLTPAVRGENVGGDLNALIAVASPGATLRVPAGVYAGPVTIDRPLTVVADGFVTIDGGGVGDVVRIAAPDVTLRGFRIRGTGNSLDRENTGVFAGAPRATIEDNQLEDVLLGISLNGAPDSLVRGNRIRGKDLDLSRRGDGIRLWSSDRTRVVDNDVAGVRDVVVWYCTGVSLVGNRVCESRYGLHLMYASNTQIEENRLADNSVGVFLMYSHDVLLRRNRLERNRGPSGYGIGLKDMDGVALRENMIVGNRVGLYVDNSPSRLDNTQEFRGNTFAFNDIALALLPAVQRNRFVENEFHENIEQVAILGSGQLRNNEFSVAGRGNFWSDYAGYDADADGVGDVPYRAMSLFESLIDREPKLRLFLYSPAQQAIELASRAFPIVRPEPKITDNAPLMRPLPLRADLGATGGLLSWWSAAPLAGLVLLIAARRQLGLAAAARGVPSNFAVEPGASPRRSAPHATHTVAPAPAASTSTTAILEIRGLRKRFGRYAAVEGLDLAVAPGQAVALWGTNGAGKTTIIKCILGLHSFEGAIRIGGADARRDGKAARRLVGYVSQELSFYDDLSAIETTRLFAALKRVPSTRAAEVLQRVELAEHAQKRVAQLSGGMKQRLALAVALLDDPPVLLLDEPTSNLDSAARRAFLQLLRGLKAAGKTIVFTTHRAEEVSGLADRVVVLQRGRVLRDGPPSTFSAACRIRIPLPEPTAAAAVELLRRAGFDAANHEPAVCVSVPMESNAAPIALLLRAGVAVQSFEIENGDQT